jgi:hypothetical protein
MGGSVSSTADAGGGSKTIQTLVTQLPILMKTYLGSLPQCPPVVIASNEFILRVLCLFVSITCLMRPVNEKSRQR